MKALHALGKIMLEAMPHDTAIIACAPHSRSLPLNRRALLQPSLPAVHNTVPNSALRLEDGSFAPAHMLPDARLERAGRQSKVERQVGPATAG